MASAGCMGLLAVLVASLAFIPVIIVKSPLPYPAVGKYLYNLTIDDIPKTSLSAFEEGGLRPNTLLLDAVRLFDNVIKASESIAFTPSGSMLLMDKYGWVHEAVEDPAAPQGWRLSSARLAHLGTGRPLGGHVDAKGDLYVCDALKGLIVLEAGPSPRRVRLLASRVSASSPIDPDTPIVYANDLDMASDGTIYFSDSQTIAPAFTEDLRWDTFTAYMAGLSWGKKTGRLLKYVPSTGEVTVLATGFWFANGVALSADESFVAMAVTNTHNVMRYWLKGPQAGSLDTLTPMLPGFPDGLSRASDGGFWVAMACPPNRDMKLLANTVIRGIVAWLPPSLRPPVGRWGAVVKLSPTGEIQGWLQDPNGTHISFLASAYERNGKLYCGTVVNDYLTVVDIPAGLLGPPVAAATHAPAPPQPMAAEPEPAEPVPSAPAPEVISDDVEPVVEAAVEAAE